MTPPVKIIIDTDIGDDVDDALAIAWAMLRPELDLRAITTVFGPVDLRAQLLAKLLQLFARQDIPFAAGERQPLAMPPGDPRHAAMTRTPNQHPLVLPGEPLPAPAACSGEELLARTIDAHAGDIWLVTIGAMTNAARLIERRPATAAKLKGIACMAAETRLLRKEYNILCDPEAARLCFRSGLVRFVGTWDVTRRVAMRPADIDALEALGTERSRALLKLTALWQPHQKWKPRPVMYDLCPLLWLFAPQLFQTEPMRLDVELAGTLTRGMTVPVGNGPEIAVTTGMDENTALQILIDTLVAGCRAG
jgi:purine nucleosidase/pyrimidine-specific ribonucleoside hydrolase